MLVRVSVLLTQFEKSNKDQVLLGVLKWYYDKNRTFPIVT